MSTVSNAPPQVVLRYVRKRLSDINDGANSDNRPWYVRLLIARPIFTPPDIVYVRRWSTASADRVACEGDVVEHWLVSATKVYPVPPVQEPPPNWLVDVDQLIVFDFAISPDASKLVINEFPPSGAAYCKCFALPDGIESSEVGTLADSRIAHGPLLNGSRSLRLPP